MEIKKDLAQTASSAKEYMRENTYAITNVFVG